MNRRQFTFAAGAALLAPGLALPDTPVPALVALQTGGCALLMRHAATEPGIGDPPGYRLDACSSQRNLSPAGREQARRAGAWLAQRDSCSIRCIQQPLVPLRRYGIADVSRSAGRSAGSAELILRRTSRARTPD
jgi:hypothetical protein